ncbi:MAG: DNA primase, partial [Rhodanobacteraceae bacterium]|nr:DNA primase [Rhodanobacteraceae bacterium]
LSLAELPGDELAWRDDLESALARLVTQADADRRQVLMAKQKAGEALSAEEKAELRMLLARRAG